MPRLTAALIAIAGILAGGLGVSLLNQPAPDTGAITAIVSDVLAKQEAPPAPIDKAGVEAIVADMLTEHDLALATTQPAEPTVAQIDPAKLNPMIENYLMSDPEILQRLSNALETKTRTAEADASRTAIASMKDVIFNDPNQVVLGNPDGDVTLVEMFDYNCSYCRSALPDLVNLLADDPELRVVLKEFPILSQGSLDAARVAVLVGKSDADYWTFHQALFTGRGQNDLDTALAAAKDVGLSPVNLQLELDSELVGKTIQNSYDIAKALNITGTPTYIIGNEVIPGAIGIDDLRSRIANMRACGQTQCEG
ncbi:DsbA family protein [Devosia rhodophyticola]|uniref:DsbA family protein n=1 Tax=Devosia rhodophyticola TaxID=3026423 RepID=A0ABY7YWA6_9HYPH|nr:DsbA family protein [Devosia rhodophyticola]WDR05660.1 DsbA family protein [Devosia rhodophyticola]